mmetsp:Transcript_9729/g.27115  ORF Transcript_9729/g.27115 Transcript_9729/m.27115 type:complete len:248 (+) Transcript_9729:421-1164(+)
MPRRDHLRHRLRHRPARLGGSSDRSINLRRRWRHQRSMLRPLRIPTVTSRNWSFQARRHRTLRTVLVFNEVALPNVLLKRRSYLWRSWRSRALKIAQHEPPFGRRQPSKDLLASCGIQLPLADERRDLFQLCSSLVHNRPGGGRHDHWLGRRSSHGANGRSHLTRQWRELHFFYRRRLRCSRFLSMGFYQQRVDSDLVQPPLVVLEVVLNIGKREETQQLPEGLRVRFSVTSLIHAHYSYCNSNKWP